MELRYTPQAREDLRNIKEYIANELCNPTAAERIIRRILNSCSNLKGNPFMGAELCKKFDIKTDMRYLISSKYIVFYKIDNNKISVIRILDGRTDYISVLLSD